MNTVVIVIVIVHVIVLIIIRGESRGPFASKRNEPLRSKSGGKDSECAAAHDGYAVERW